MDSPRAANLASVSARPRVGVVGAGQLARMMAESAPRAGVDVVVLAESESDSAVLLGGATVLGSPRDRAALDQLAARCDVVTFDHELVDLDLLGELERGGTVIFPSPEALRWASDKAHQRRALAELGLPVPRFVVVEALDQVDEALQDWPSPPVVKSARGGYDGRGVVVTSSIEEARVETLQFLRHSPVVLEERVPLLAEVAQLVARSPSGELATYPLVTTVQVEGMCAEVLYPTPHQTSDARLLAESIAEHIGLVGIMAVELFVTPAGLLVNEVALRPHNSGHWTIEGCRTSQFENHLRAVSAQPLGDCDAMVTAAAMVNLVGGDQPSDDDAPARHPDVAFHLYGKSWRPGRKLGHVTAVGENLDDARARAWAAARDWGTREGVRE